MLQKKSKKLMPDLSQVTISLFFVSGIEVFITFENYL